jgi:glyoxylate utilization-related uncharacterized protein
MKHITVDQYEVGMEWAGIVRAAGMFSDKHHPFQLYLLAGAIMRDAEVVHRVCRLNEGDSAFVPPGAYEQVLNEMTAAERATLKARIVARFSKGQ